MFGKEDKEIRKLIEEAVVMGIKNAIQDTKSTLGKLNQIAKLKEEIEDLRIEKKTREWDFQKREMEVEHKVGLERKRQEFELEQAKREAVVELREKNLASEQEAFKKQMDFIDKRFTDEVKYLKEILTEVLKTMKEAKGQGSK